MLKKFWREQCWVKVRTAEDSLLGKAQPLHKSLKQTFSRLLSIAIINCIALIYSVVALKYWNV